MNWQALSSTSHYQTAKAIEQELRIGNTQEATIGIQELIDALARSERRALKSQLVCLMMHIIKWKSQLEKRSRSWVASIYNAREEIVDIQAEIPSLTNVVIQEMWEKCFQAAQREAEGEMNKKSELNLLSWNEVFEEVYEIS